MTTLRWSIRVQEQAHGQGQTHGEDPKASDKIERSERFERPERPGKSGKVERSEKSDKLDKTEKHEKLEIHTLRGTVDIPSEGGKLLLNVDLPKGSLRSVKAQVNWTIDGDEEVFMNGYQSWSYCPEYGKYQKIKGVNGVPRYLQDKYHFDRFGDFHFGLDPNRWGVNHGFSYCYFRLGSHFRLIASLDEAPGYTLFRYDSIRGKLTISRDCRGLDCGGSYPALELFFAEGEEQEVFDQWFEALGIPKPRAKRIKGYTSWYNLFEDISELSIRADLDGCAQFLDPGDLFQIDDGWEAEVGDWLEPDWRKFPSGMKALADAIHQKGFMAGIWLAPFVCDRTSNLYQEHPDWLLRVNGEPWNCGGKESHFYSLDVENPEVKDYLSQVFDKVFNQWGYDLVKLDYLFGVAPVGGSDRSRAARMIDALDFVRELCGDKLILACGVPLMPAFGRVDYCRVGCDVSLDWEDKWYLRHLHRERTSTRLSVGNTIFRRQLDGRAFLNDPDVIFLREENIALTHEQRARLAMIDALLGSVLLTSDETGKYNFAQRDRFRALALLQQAEDVRVVDDPRKGGLLIRYKMDGAEQYLTIPKAWYQ